MSWTFWSEYPVRMPKTPDLTISGCVCSIRSGSRGSCSAAAGHACDDDHILAAPEGTCGSEAEAIEALVDRGVFLDVEVTLQDVRRVRR